MAAGMADDGSVTVETELKATDPIKDDPTLPRVLLIGDSISIGCTYSSRVSATRSQRCRSTVSRCLQSH